MSPPSILDTHIHLWPSTATSSSDHGWMSPGHQLAKRHGISDYLAITSPQPSGFIYVETDRYLPSAEPPNINESNSDDDLKDKLRSWAKEPLEELRFLARIVEGRPEEGDGFVESGAEKMKGCVIYAPFHCSPRVLNAYLDVAREVAGPKLWQRTKGFRYLLQGKGDGVVARMLQESEESWIQNLCALKQDGEEPMKAVGRLIAGVRQYEEKEGHTNRVKFVLNHLAKPPLSPKPTPPSDIWLQTMTSLSSDKAIFMKLSGAFNEFTVSPTPSDIPTLLTALTPFLDHIFTCFPGRVMFGSDWPVCNVGGPAGEQGSWKLWREVVEKWMDVKGYGEEERKRIWRGAGEEAYGVAL
ncbi:L-rhamnono-1,4-lactonase [Alternaria panax]|uniref:L-rhamnono-1,4-lactonase n=1 Tax=Alternaria panax TaxID=48097 RepID=A0AAD4FFG4_9PLEO|nr:L-rhamnono-1,4-lactonase [Alternaria panax]